MATFPQPAEPLDPDDVDKAYTVPFAFDPGVSITAVVAQVVDPDSVDIDPDTDMTISNVVFADNGDGTWGVSFAPSLGGTTTPKLPLYRIRLHVTLSTGEGFDHTVQIKVRQN